MGRVFLTGYPGFIAGSLLRRLAVGGQRFFLLVQPSFHERALSELSQIARQTQRSAEDFQIISGDVTEKQLGISERELARIRAETTIVFHLAALYDLAVSREAALRVNVEGTRNVNQFARLLPELRHYHYVSTCYVAGRRTGRILENELRHDAGFRNFYEESKYLAEIEVERLKGDLPVTIHRPSVVCGDSKTGETVKYDGVYYLINYLLSWPGLLSKVNIGNQDVSLNLVPVDFVADALAVLMEEAEAIGKTLQLADPAPLSTAQLFDTIARCITGRGSWVTAPAWLVEKTLMSPPSPSITGLPHHGVPYFFLRQTYDTTEASGLLLKHQLRCPQFSSYAQTIVNYAAQHRAAPAAALSSISLSLTSRLI